MSSTTTTTTTEPTNHSAVDNFDFATFDLPQNYSLLINQLERLALGLNSAFNNFSTSGKEIEVNVTETNEVVGTPPLPLPPLVGQTPPQPPPHLGHGANIGEVERVVSDIWIGVVLTLLIVTVIFFICSCFVYHKFQQWKSSYRTSHAEPEVCRHYIPDFEVESLPSYTIVSGLPTYDDALEEFRKAGIILTPSIPVVKLFERDSKDSKDNQFNTIHNLESVLINDNNGEDNISLNSTCTCGASVAGNSLNSNNSGQSGQSGHSTSIPTVAQGVMPLNYSNLAASNAPQVIELSPEQLATLSQKRLSLQIAFGHSARRNSRPRIVNLYRQANRNNMFRARALSNAGVGAYDNFPQIHRSSSSLSLSMGNEQTTMDRLHLQHLQHRGSLY